MTTEKRQNRKLTVLLIAPSPEIVGGQAVQAMRLIRELRKEPRLVVIFQPLDVKLPSWIRKTPILRTALGWITYCIRLAWTIPQCDIVHVFSAGLSSFALWTIPAVNIGKMLGKKCIVNYRDGRVEEHLNRSRNAKPVLLRASVVISPSRYVVDVLGEAGIPARRIFNIIDVGRFKYRQRRKLQPVFLTNRSLEPLYNVDCILRAFSIIQDKHPEAKLIVAHDGVRRTALEGLAKELNLRNTKFVGRVAYTQIPDLYNSADIYLTSPNVDCMPGSILESFASGVPVIATKAGGIPCVVTHERTGLLVELNDHKTMAEYAIRLLEDPELVEKLTRNAYQEVQQYGPSEIRHEWIELYSELIGTAGTPGESAFED